MPRLNLDYTGEWNGPVTVDTDECGTELLHRLRKQMCRDECFCFKASQICEHTTSDVAIVPDRTCAIALVLEASVVHIILHSWDDMHTHNKYTSQIGDTESR